MNLKEYVRTYRNYPNLLIHPNADGHQEIIIIVGPPTAGKSYVAEKFARLGHVLINVDTLKTKVKCMKMAETAIAAGKNIVVDHTHPDPESRFPYLQLAVKRSTDENPIDVKAIILNTPMDLVYHLNGYRVMSTKSRLELISPLIYKTFTKKYVKPSRDEGFVLIDEIPFIPQFANELNEKQFYYHYF